MFWGLIAITAVQGIIYLEVRGKICTGTAGYLRINMSCIMISGTAVPGTWLYKIPLYMQDHQTDQPGLL